MATPADISTVERVIGYAFNDKRLITLALTAAGAEEHNHDGNRSLALFGEQLIQFLVSWSGWKKGATRGKADPNDNVYFNRSLPTRSYKQYEEPC
jgi:hypothetical protein